ncbi:NADH-quinone oxidoreductase subunit C [Candidatus Peregrinibacteria bacterium]|nr:NADH-quinone oxidoreductase subunit C [Candidatus Peregrinibacteria bacterium]
MNIPSLHNLQKISNKFPTAKWLGFLPKAEGFIVSPHNYHRLCHILKDDYGFTYLSCLTAKDMILKKEFELIVHLENIEKNEIIWLKVPVNRDAPTLPTITDLWRGADFLERETYDMFGIIFEGHPNLTRILSPEDETIHPLRKDFTKENNKEYGKKIMEKLLTH